MTEIIDMGYSCDSCGSCSSCSSCSSSCGCGSCDSCDSIGCCCSGDKECVQTVRLTAEELKFLDLFTQAPFLPVISNGTDIIYPERYDLPQETVSRLIISLSNKALIRIDEDIPLSNYDYCDCDCDIDPELSDRNFTCHGSMALTAFGQQIVEQLEIQGIDN